MTRKFRARKPRPVNSRAEPFTVMQFTASQDVFASIPSHHLKVWLIDWKQIKTNISKKNSN